MGELYNPFPKLPKNIRQIGDTDQVVRLYVEDYVNTYLKRLYPAGNQTLRVGLLLGNTENYDGTPYIFIDGAIEMEDVEVSGEKVEFSENAWKKGRCARDSACERNLPPLATFPSPGSSAGRRAETHYFYRAYACPRSCGLRTASAAASALDCGSSGDVSKTFPVRLCRFDMFCRSPMLYFGKNSTKRVYVVRVNKEAAGLCLDMPAA